MYRKIISAVDGSFHSELAARHAVAIASSLGSQLTVLAVDAGEVERKKLSYAIEHLRQHAGTYGIQAKGIIRKGEVVKTILAVINEENADLLVLAKFYSYKVEILHVIEFPRWYDLPWIRLYTMRRQGEETMAPVADALKALGINVDVRVVVAESSINAIPKEAAIGRHSMALMGASRRSILKEVVYGNPIERMLSSILCDVLIWRRRL
ncbi:universal stress protein [Candidatus Methanoperedens nitratireducens]|uniref:UspA domain-containing protein n=1 Tax=Candidatus Methanoperedens nitratireducens TaxID=1392998 RepID=A0A284VJ86_9EURY|nr:universal stress protein [Candidatus Methanoperedens nitroreducens]SNQ59320.1 hypothetical protein MNV_1140016 [Candidatus Methanoperedens nitroreducens]